MREIVLDTETTGLDPKSGHRLIEIGCLELVNHIPSGKSYHVYINPEREVPEEAFNVHGLSTEFLKDFPVFSDVYEDFLKFIDDAPLVIHNARFDLKFLNAELAAVDSIFLPYERSIDTLKIAKQKFPGSPANLDALCRRFEIDNTNRVKHGALLDAELLVEVYLELIGKRQPHLNLDEKKAEVVTLNPVESNKKQPREVRFHGPSEAEQERHQKFLEKLKNPLWQAP